MPHVRNASDNGKILLTSDHGQASVYTLHENNNHFKIIGHVYKSVERGLLEQKPPNIVALVD
jgi:hypothetical protein